MNPQMIDLEKYFTTNTVSGRERGELVRKENGLEPGRTNSIVIVVPQRVHTITASFFGGLLGAIMLQAGSHAAIRDRVRFRIAGDQVEVRERMFRDAMDREYNRVIASEQPLL